MSSLRQILVRACFACWLAVVLMGCGTGTIGATGSEDPDFGLPFAGPGDSPGMPTPGGTPNPPPLDPTAPLPTFAYASVGTRCVAGENSDWVVLSRDPVDCAAHADFASAPTEAFVRLRLPPGSSGQETVRATFCSTPNDCAERDVRLSIADFSPGEVFDATWSVQLGDRVATGDVQATRCAYDPPDNPARAIEINDVLVNQGVAVSLGDSTGAVSVANRNAPLVAGRDAVFQIGVATEGTWQARELTAQVTINGEVAAAVPTFVDGTSNPSDPDTLISIPVSGERIVEGASVSVGLFEIENCVDQPGNILAPKFPESGDTPLGARSMGGPFRVVLVPVRWNADGSGRVPDLSGPVVQDFADGIRALFPVDDVEVSVRQPLDYDQNVSSGGDGWTQLLTECLNLRSDDDPSDEVYYYCLFQPTEDFRTFCSPSCVSGIGPVPSASDTYRRGAIGLSFDGSGVGTFVHEIGHALGRRHAPCGGADGSDGNYPYPDARIGVWGYDLIGGTHVPPDHRDVMSYCGPTWISDYHFDLIFDRIETVYTTFAQKSLALPVQYLTVVVDADLSLSWGRDAALPVPPEGDPVTVEFLDQTGAVTGRTTGAFQSVTHIPGGTIMIPAPPELPFAVRIDGFGSITR